MADDPTPPAELLAALLSDAGELAAVLDADGRLTSLNPAGRRLLGLAADEPLPERHGLDPRGRGRPPRARGRPAAGPRRPRCVDRHPQRGHAAGTEVPTRSTLRSHPDGTTTWVARDISTERAVYERLHRKVFEDELTGLPHRSIFLDRLDLSLRRTIPGAPPVTLLFVGIDRFRERSDRLAPDAPRPSSSGRWRAARRRSGTDRQRGAVGRRRVRRPLRGRGT